MPDVTGLLDLADDPISAVLGLLVVLLLLPLVLVVMFGLVLFSAELVLLLGLLPFLMLGQLLGTLPWVLVLTDASGQKSFVEVAGTRAMLAGRRYYRSRRV